MIAIDKMTDDQFERHALDVLKREFGPDGLARFLRLHRSGKGDSSLDRDEWQKNLTVDEVVESVHQRRA
ncbi:MAG: hypothetical protein LAQ69_21620 [Acidobacteriia bacterium]|nr:hypothetical protein [Terriglobia bacterium]